VRFARLRTTPAAYLVTTRHASRTTIVAPKRISQSANRGDCYEASDKDGTFNPPKRKSSKRTVGLTVEGVKALIKHKACQNDRRLRFGNQPLPLLR
jgi:hypothetical protein